MLDDRPADLQQEPPKAGFLLNVNFVFATNVTTYSISFFSFLILARVLGPDGRGVISLFQAAVTLGFTFISLGIALAAMYYVSKRELRDRQLLEHGVTVTLGALALTGVVVGGLWLFLGEELSEEGIPYWLGIAAVPLMVQFRLVEGVLRGQGRFMTVNAMELTFPIVNVSGLVLTELLVGLTVGRAITIWTASLVPCLALGYLFVGPSAWPRRPAIDPHLPRVLLFGVQGQSGNLVQLLNYRLDSYLILLFVNTAGVGLYAVGVALSEGLWFIANAVAVVLIPKLAAGDPEYAAKTAPVVARNTLAVTAVFAVGLAVLSPVLIPLFFGEAFRGAIAPFLWLLPGTVALAAAKILSAYVFSRGRPLINTGIAAVTLVVTLVLDLALIPPFGVSGAAIASSVAYFVSLTLTAIAFRRLSGRPIAEALVPRPSDIPLYVEGVKGIVARFRPAVASIARNRSNP
jgi:O-antigen/teichoic acid export membrane protein